MSDTRLHIGKLIKTGVPLEDVITTDDLPEMGLYDSAEDWFNHEHWGKKIALNGVIYDIATEDLIEEDISTMTPNDDGGYDFVFKYYSGSTCLLDCIEEAHSKIEEAGI